MTSLLIKFAAFLASFLLFQLEFIVGKMMLPLFGGSFMVWGACVVFFQAVLLLGYVWSEAVSRRLAFRRYCWVHGVLLVAPLLFTFPGRRMVFDAMPWKGPLFLNVSLLLLLKMGLVFFVLCTVNIFLQLWLGQSRLPGRENPYFLYGISNLGSFAALFTYPFFFEMRFGLMMQQRIWQVLYALVVVLQLALIIRARALRTGPDRDAGTVPEAPVPRVQQLSWLGFGASGVIMMLAVTNIVTAKILPAPLLWMFPLAIYLFTFFLAFKSRPWHFPGGQRGFQIVVLLGVLLYVLVMTNRLPVVLELSLLFAVLFAVCLLSQAELYASRPQQQRALPRFYVWIAAGGVCGGMVTTWLVPLLSFSFTEYWLALIVLALSWQLRHGQRMFIVQRWPVLLLGLVLAVFVLTGFGWLELLCTALLIQFILSEFYQRGARLRQVLVAAMILAVVLIQWKDARAFVYKKRNFYGLNRVFEGGGVRYYLNGTTIHGAQFLKGEEIPTPLAYYSPLSPLGEFFRCDAFRFRKVGSLGFGVGSFLSYLPAGVIVDSYELDRDVLHIAKRYFDFWARSRAQVRHIVGDARMSLANQPAQGYDLLLVDTFGGDSIPVHLLTREAFAEYARQVHPEGVIMIHLSCHAIDIRPQVLQAAQDLGAQVSFKWGGGDGQTTFPSLWMAVSRNERAHHALTTRLGWEDLTSRDLPTVRPWTDDFSCIVPYFRTFLN